MKLGPKLELGLLRSERALTWLIDFRNTQPVRDSFNNEASQPPSSGFISVVVLTSEKARVAAQFSYQGDKLQSCWALESANDGFIFLNFILKSLKPMAEMSDPFPNANKYGFLALGSFQLK